MSTFEELQARVAGDTALQERLQGAESVEGFIGLVDDLAQDLGLDLDRDTIQKGIEAAAAAVSTELPEEDLESVAGGTLTGGTRVTLVCAGKLDRDVTITMGLAGINTAMGCTTGFCR